MLDDAVVVGNDQCRHAVDSIALMKALLRAHFELLHRHGVALEVLGSFPDPGAGIASGGCEDGDEPRRLGPHEVSSVQQLGDMRGLHVPGAAQSAEQRGNRAGDRECSENEEYSIHGSAVVVARTDFGRLGSDRFSRIGWTGSRDIDQAVDF